MNRSCNKSGCMYENNKMIYFHIKTRIFQKIKFFYSFEKWLAEQKSIRQWVRRWELSLLKLKLISD